MSENGNPGILTDNVINLTGLSTSTWYHFAIVRSGTALTLYRDGEVAGTGTKAGTISGYSLGLLIGSYSHDSSGTYDFNGYIEEVRISHSARWTSDFSGSLPTEPYTSDANTKLLLHMNGDVSDGAHVVTSNGNPQLNAATTKFNGSMYFDGSPDNVTIPNSESFNFGAGDFTIDFWVKCGSVGSNGSWLSWGDPYLSGPGWWFKRNESTGILWFGLWYSGSAVKIADSEGDWTNSWVHIAVARHGNTMRSFINGTIKDTADWTGITISNPTGRSLDIGRIFLTGYGWYYPSAFYMDELRISKGIARWTSNFTPESGPYTE